MASTEDITLNGISPRGTHEPHYSDEKVVYDEVTLSTYDNANDGNGNSLDVSSIYGFSRLLFVETQVLGSDGFVARWDYTNDSIRVFAQDNDGSGGAGDQLSEVSQGTTIDIDIRLRIVGVGT